MKAVLARRTCHLSLAAAFATALFAGATFAQTAPPPPGGFELDALLGREIVSSVAAAADMPRIAWVSNLRGVRNLWTAAAPDFAPQQLTRYTKDDGQALSDLRLSGDGSLLLFTRGSGPNAAGDVANPSSDPAGAGQAQWAVPTDGRREPWRLADGGNGVLVASGKTVLLARGNQAFELEVAAPPATAEPQPAGTTSGDEAPAPPEPKLLFTARGSLGNLTPLPDGNVGFVSGRGDHSFVGVFDRAAKSLRWIAPGVDRDGAPAFSKDGSRVAFIRMPGARVGERFDLTAGSRFAIWVGDPRTGQAHEVWQSPADAGGFAQFYPQTALAWAGADDLLLTSEHAGFLHLHHLDLSAGESPPPAVDLTPGDFEIEGFVLTSDTATAYVWGNHDDIDRRHIQRIDIATGQRHTVTHGDGIEAEPLPLADGSLVYRAADARRPMTIMVAAGDGSKAHAIAPAPWPGDVPLAALTEPAAVTFRAADGTEIHGQLFRPPARTGADAKHPAVIFLHGGPIRQMLLGWHYSDYYANAYAFNQFLASRGYLVLSVNYRAGIGYGRDFRRAAGQGPRGAAEYQDVVAGGRFLAARDDVDPARIGLWGGSYGGLLTAMGLARDSELFAAGVDLHGVHDWSFRATDFPTPGGIWGLGEADLELARSSSPVAAVDTWRSPVLFIHGDDDRNVLFQQTTDLVQRLRDHDVHHEVLVFPDEVHGFLRYTSWLRTFEAAYDFFERFLGKP